MSLYRRWISVRPGVVAIIVKASVGAVFGIEGDRLVQI